MRIKIIEYIQLNLAMKRLIFYGDGNAYIIFLSRVLKFL